MLQVLISAAQKMANRKEAPGVRFCLRAIQSDSARLATQRALLVIGHPLHSAKCLGVVVCVC